MNRIFKNIYVLISSGFLLLKFYGWFILPIFTSLPEINFLQAVGLNLVFYFFNKISSSDVLIYLEFKEKYENENLFKYYWILYPWTVLFLGYLVKLLINIL